MNFNLIKPFCLAFALMIVLVTQSAIASEKQQVSYYGSSGAYLYKNQYFVNLLEAIFAKTETQYSPVELNLVSERLSQNRIVKLMSSRCLADIIWLVASDEREQKLLPVRIPLLKGLSGYRSLMIRQDKQPLFDKIETEQQLATLSAGQGADWPDTFILQHNGYNVLPVNNFIALFDMLVDNRFDYFPRSVTEIAGELEHYAEKPLAAERNFMLYYPSPVYFFVCPEKPELVSRLARGMELAIADGTFDELFWQSAEYQSFIRTGGFAQKTIFSMNNPNLDPGTLARDKALWLTPENHAQALVPKSPANTTQ